MPSIVKIVLIQASVVCKSFHGGPLRLRPTRPSTAIQGQYGPHSPLDDLVDGVQEVLFRDGLSPCAHRVHACLRAHAADVGARAVGAQAREQLKADVTLAVHGARVDLEDLRPALQVWQAELNLSGARQA